jgi:biotin carboxylase
LSGYAVRPFWAEERPVRDTIAFINDYVQERGIEVIIPGDMATTAFLAEIASEVRGAACFFCSPREKLDALHNKWNFAQTLERGSIPTPRTRLLEEVEGLSATLSQLEGFPLMVKPLERESSHGVLRVDSESQLRAYLSSGAPYNAPPLILQEFIPGRDIDFSVLARRGRVVAGAVQRWSDSGTLAFCRHEEVEDLGRRVVASFEYHGVAHFDMRIDDRNGRVVVLECNPRFWYTMPAAMWRGLNFVEAGIRAVMNADLLNSWPEGNYILPGSVPSALFSVRRVRELDIPNLRGFLQPVLDPLPHMYSLARKAFRLS